MISDLLLADVIRHLDAGVYILDAEMRLLYMNPQAEEWLGWSSEELVGRNIHDAIHHQKADGSNFPADQCPVGKVLKLGLTYETDDDVFTRRDGSLMPVRYVSSPILEGGRVVAVGTVFHDISTEKERNAREVLLHEIDRRVLGGVALDFILQFASERLAQLYRFPLVRVVLRGLPREAVQVAAVSGPAAGFLTHLERECRRCWQEQGPMGRVLEGGPPEVMHFDQHPSEALRSGAAGFGIGSALVLPLRTGERTLGALELFATGGDAFRGEGVPALENLAERLALAAMVAEEQRRLRLQGTAMHTTANAILITDRNGTIEWVNPAFTGLSGYAAEEAIGLSPNLLKSGVQEPDFYRELWQTVLAGYPWKGEVVQKHKDGHLYTVEQTITPIRGDHGEISHFIAIHQDITERKEAEVHIQQLAFYDSLTGLPNRRLFQDRLEQAVARARREETLMALFFLDLDNFKDVNDSLGHEVGDALLQGVAERLREVVRGNDTVARLGGDEFAIVQAGLTNVGDAAALADEVIEAISRPFESNGHHLFTGTSIGITIYPFDDSDVALLVKNADTAMYRAKAQGGNVYQFFTADMNLAVRARMSLLSDLHRALERREFSLFYQPQVSLKEDRIIGLEALVRWHHPERGLISPAEFIPIAEESGLIVPLGHWVLHEACRQNKAWQEAGLPPVRMAVNISARQFRQGAIVEAVALTLANTGLDPDCLELEVTESALMDNVEEAISTMHQLRALGVHLAIDDFGTGYSSMSYLQRFPIDHLKIAAEFVRELGSGAQDVAIAKAIIDMGHSLNLKVIAEGVETDDQLQRLLSEGCDEKQGFLFSRPVPANELEELLRDSQSLQVEI